MILSDHDIRYALKHDGLRIDPLTEGAIRPASVDLKLHHQLLIYEAGQGLVVDPWRELRPVPTVVQLDDSEGYPLNPGAWLLAATAEVVSLPKHLVGIICGKSSWARDGVSIEDAGYVDPHWTGRLTLEIKNNGPLTVMLYPGVYICQIRFMRVLTPGTGYDEFEGSHYQQSSGPVMNMRASGTNILSLDVDRYGRPRNTREE